MSKTNQLCINLWCRPRPTPQTFSQGGRVGKKKSKDVLAVTSSKSLLAALANGQIRFAQVVHIFRYLLSLWILLRAHVEKSYVSAHFHLDRLFVAIN